MSRNISDVVHCSSAHKAEVGNFRLHLVLVVVQLEKEVVQTDVVVQVVVLVQVGQAGGAIRQNRRDFLARSRSSVIHKVFSKSPLHELRKREAIEPVEVASVDFEDIGVVEGTAE